MWAKFKELPKGVRYVVYAVPFVVVIAVLVVVLVGLLTPHEYDRVTVVNGEALDEMSGGAVNDFRTGLIDLLQREGYVGEDATVDDVVVREGTVETFRNGEAGAVTTFLVDIPSVRQTYRVQVTDGGGEMTDVPAYITCPKAEEMKYPDTECRGHYGSTSAAVETYLPYSGVLASGEKYLVKSVSLNKTGERVLQIYLYSCGADAGATAALVKEVEQAVRDFVVSTGDTDSYIYNVRTGYCEGDAI